MKVKYHAIVASFLMITMSAIMVFTTPGQANQPISAKPIDERFIQISKATWGKNCNAYVGAKNSAHNVTKPIRRNNILRPLSSLCNGLEHCAIEASSETFGFDPAQTCHKAVEVEYRCMTTGRINKTRSIGSKSLVIDCRNNAG